MPISYAGESNEWESALAAAGALYAFSLSEQPPERDAVIGFLGFALDNPSSIKHCLATARHNGRAERTALTTEMWEAINSGWLELKRFDGARMDPDTLTAFLSRVKEACMLF